MELTPQLDRPLIAVIGSLDASRADYYPPLKNLEHGEQACQELGRAIAKAGCDLAVFTSKPKYVEAWVVQGYAEASTADKPGRVVAHLPSHAEVAFDVPKDKVEVVTRTDTSGEWELPYYRALSSADGVVLIGGGQSTRIGGIVTLLHGVPLLPVTTFGGGAAYVRTNLDHVRNDVTPEDISLMGRQWSDGLAERLIASLLAQGARRRQRLLREARGVSRRALAGRIALVVTMLALVASWLAVAFVGPAGPPGARSLVITLATPMLAAVAGALLRNYQADDPTWGWAAARGLGAGLVTVFLYIAGELLSVPDLMTNLNAQRLLFFLVPLGFAAGFTFDLVFERLRAEQIKVPPTTPVRDE
jgi:hypothetical protein